MLNILLYIWQIPQNLVGLLIKLLMCTSLIKYTIIQYKTKYKTLILFRSNFRGGISLGKYIFLGKGCGIEKEAIKHEYGHTLQSIILGPLYLFIIGIPSILHAATYTSGDYYKFWTEKWANNLSKNEQL